MSATDIATSKSGPFQHALALGMLLVVTSLAGTAFQQHCTRKCDANTVRARVELDACMEKCRIDYAGLTTANTYCEKACDSEKKPFTTYEKIKQSIKQCGDRCFPPRFLIFAVHQVGSVLILATMAFLFCARSSCGHSRLCKQPCVAYAWCFFVISSLLFVVGLSDTTEIVGVQVAFIFASTSSILCEALVEFRESVLEPEENAGFFKRRFGIAPSMLGHDNTADDEMDALAETAGTSEL